jgi:hypothetical protein
MGFNRPIQHPKILSAVSVLCAIAVIAIIITKGDFETVSYLVGIIDGAIIAVGALLIIALAFRRRTARMYFNPNGYYIVLFLFTAVACTAIFNIYGDFVPASFIVGAVAGIIIAAASLAIAFFTLRHASVAQEG